MGTVRRQQENYAMNKNDLQWKLNKENEIVYSKVNHILLRVVKN